MTRLHPDSPLFPYTTLFRSDWQRTTVARFGEPGPKYVTYLDPGPPDKRVIAQMNHELDIIHDVSPEGMFTLAKQSKDRKSTRLNSSHRCISYAVFCLKKKKT